MSGAVIDASALIALLLAEPGADKVQAALPSATMSTVNYAEIVGFFARNGATDDAIQALLSPLPIQLTPLDTDLARAAGMLLPATRRAGLSLGDRACLALAHRLGVPALTADRAWSDIADTIGVNVTLIR